MKTEREIFPPFSGPSELAPLFNEGVDAEAIERVAQASVNKLVARHRRAWGWGACRAIWSLSAFLYAYSWTRQGAAFYQARQYSAYSPRAIHSWLDLTQEEAALAASAMGEAINGEPDEDRFIAAMGSLVDERRFDEAVSALADMADADTAHFEEIRELLRQIVVDLSHELGASAS